jgi:signal transduction histidine kinase
METSPAAEPAGSATAPAPLSPPWFTALFPAPGSRPVPDVLDMLVAVASFAAFTGPVLVSPGLGAGSRWLIALFGALAAAPLVLRRRWPLAVVVAVTAGYVAATLAGVQFTPFVSSAGPSLAIAVFTAADRCGRRASLTVLAIAGVLTWAVLPLGIRLHPGVDQDATAALVAIPAWILGDMARARRGYQQRLAAETRRLTAEQAQRAQAEERLRLSRDVHDVVSHSLSAIAVRSGVARLLIDEQPGEARAALAAIETASRAALDEVRALLRQVRDDPGAGPEVALPGLADLPALLARLRRDGLEVSCEHAGAPRDYPAAVEMSAYRIIQEALTNVIRHAPGARAEVTITHGGAELGITVTDDGPPGTAVAGLASPGPDSPRAAPAGPGLGITGMRERTALLGGQLTAAARPGGGFAVTARLPVGPEPVGPESVGPELVCAEFAGEPAGTGSTGSEPGGREPAGGRP